MERSLKLTMPVSFCYTHLCSSCRIFSPFAVFYLLHPKDGKELFRVAEPDDVLVERAKSEPEAFGALYERYVTKVYSYVYYRTGSVLDAEDLTERVFFQALTHLGSYDSRGVPFSAWLLRIAHNLVANWYRDNSRRRTIRLDDAQQTDDDSADLESREEQSRVRKALAKLPRERQHVIVLKYVEEMSNAEIGQVMGRSEGAVKALLHRTLISLRKELDTGKDGRR